MLHLDARLLRLDIKLFVPPVFIVNNLFSNHLGCFSMS